MGVKKSGDEKRTSKKSGVQKSTGKKVGEKIGKKKVGVKQNVCEKRKSTKRGV